MFPRNVVMNRATHVRKRREEAEEREGAFMGTKRRNEQREPRNVQLVGEKERRMSKGNRSAMHFRVQTPQKF